jgi:hypothetical protein
LGGSSYCSADTFNSCLIQGCSLMTRFGSRSSQNLCAGSQFAQNREVAERSVIQRALANNENSRAQVAHSLGISRVTLYKKMKRLQPKPARDWPDADTRVVKKERKTIAGTSTKVPITHRISFLPFVILMAADVGIHAASEVGGRHNQPLQRS